MLFSRTGREQSSQTRSGVRWKGGGLLVSDKARLLTWENLAVGQSKDGTNPGSAFFPFPESNMTHQGQSFLDWL